MVTCPWDIDIADCCEPLDIEPDDPRVASIIAQVSAMLSAWSGYAYGGCRTVRPLDPCGECRSGCCASGDCIVLHTASDVLEVRIDGEVVDPDEYHYDVARGTLCAVPPLSWPNADPRFESVGSLEVDVRIGSEPDSWALAVANELACELLASCMNDKKCRLPKNATRVTAQGVTIEMTADELKYALPSVLSWVNTVNPHGSTRPARLFSAEARRGAVVGGRHSLPDGRRVARYRGF